MSHPDPSVLRTFLQTLSVADAGFVLHLLECPRCSRKSWRTLAPRPLPRRPGESAAQLSASFLDENTLSRMAERVASAASVAQEGRRNTAWELLEQSWRTEDPAECESLGRLAAAAAEKLDGTGLAAGLASSAWCSVGEACRRQGLLEAAEAAFGSAVLWLEKSIDPADSAGYCRQLSRLRRDQRRFDEAMALLERAATLAGSAGQTRDQALALADLAAIHLHLEDLDSAVAALDRALALGPAAVDPGLASGAGGGIAGCLAALGDPLQERRVLAALADLPGRRRTALERAVLVRIEGLVAAFARQEQQAELLLREAWNGFHRAGALGYALLAGLDLAALFLRQERASNLRSLGGEVRIAFQSRTLGPLGEGVRAAIEDLIRTLETGSARPEHLAVIARYIAHAMIRPDLPYPRAA